LYNVGTVFCNELRTEATRALAHVDHLLRVEIHQVQQHALLSGIHARYLYPHQANVRQYTARLRQTSYSYNGCPESVGPAIAQELGRHGHYLFEQNVVGGTRGNSDCKCNERQRNTHTPHLGAVNAASTHKEHLMKFLEAGWEHLLVLEYLLGRLICSSYGRSHYPEISAIREVRESNSVETRVKAIELSCETTSTEPARSWWYCVKHNPSDGTLRSRRYLLHIGYLSRRRSWHR
jgi:hypothetical protein